MKAADTKALHFPDTLFFLIFYVDKWVACSLQIMMILSLEEEIWRLKKKKRFIIFKTFLITRENVKACSF